MGEHADDALDQALEEMLDGHNDYPPGGYVMPVNKKEVNTTGNKRVQRPPDYNLMLRGKEFSPRKQAYVWMRIGSAWEEPNGMTIHIDFPVPFIVGPDTKIRLLENKRKDNFDTDSAEEDFQP